MAKPIPQTGEEHLQRLAQDVAILRSHTHPENVPVPAEPYTVNGSRSTQTVVVLQQVLIALDALGIIDDQTTG